MLRKFNITKSIEIERMLENLDELKSMAVNFENFDGAFNENIKIVFTLKFGHSNDDIEINFAGDRFLNDCIFQQYQKLINDFGSSLYRLADSHSDQLESLKKTTVE